jgi:hypothetical protein
MAMTGRFMIYMKSSRDVRVDDFWLLIEAEGTGGLVYYYYPL